MNPGHDTDSVNNNKKKKNMFYGRGWKIKLALHARDNGIEI